MTLKQDLLIVNPLGRHQPVIILPTYLKVIHWIGRGDGFLVFLISDHHHHVYDSLGAFFVLLAVSWMIDEGHSPRRKVQPDSTRHNFFSLDPSHNPKFPYQKKMRFVWIFFSKGGVLPIPKGCYHKKLGILDIFAKRGCLIQSIGILS